MPKFYCHGCKTTHEGKPDYVIMETWILEKMKEPSKMTKRQYEALFRKAGFEVCRMAANNTFFAEVVA